MTIHIYPYGLVVAASAVLSLLLAGRQLRARQMKQETLAVFAAWCLPLSFLFARLLYCLICMDGFTRSGIAYFFDFTSGGYTLWGAIPGGCLAAYITGKHTRQSFAQLADALAAPAALMIALGRLAEGVVGQGYGWYVEDWFDPMNGMSLFHPEEYGALLRFPFAVQDMYGEWCWAIFVLEALIALVICALLLRAHAPRPGMTALRGLLLLAAAQILCESLRQDAVLRFGFVRVNQIISAAVIVALLVYGCILTRDKKRMLPAAIGTAVCIGVVVTMEFALEKKVVLLEQLPMDVCYALTAAACIGLIACVSLVLDAGHKS